jgi:Flp pilus assembly protein TadD
MILKLLVILLWVLAGGNGAFAGARIEKGLEYLRQGKLNEAEREIQGALRTENQAEAYNILGIIYDRQGKNAEGQRAYLESLKLSPNSAPVRHNLGNSLVAQGKVLEAIDQFERALEIDPAHLSSHFMPGRIFFSQNNFDAAINHLEIVRRKAPGDVEALFYLSNAYFQNQKRGAGLEVARSISELAVRT